MDLTVLATRRAHSLIYVWLEAFSSCSTTDLSSLTSFYRGLRATAVRLSQYGSTFAQPGVFVVDNLRTRLSTTKRRFLQPSFPPFQPRLGAFLQLQRCRAFRTMSRLTSVRPRRSLQTAAKASSVNRQNPGLNKSLGSQAVVINDASLSVGISSARMDPPARPFQTERRNRRPIFECGLTIS